jgi:hypothetical protein
MPSDSGALTGALPGGLRDEHAFMGDSYLYEEIEGNV